MSLGYPLDQLVFLRATAQSQKPEIMSDSESDSSPEPVAIPTISVSHVASPGDLLKEQISQSQSDSSSVSAAPSLTFADRVRLASTRRAVVSKSCCLLWLSDESADIALIPKYLDLMIVFAKNGPKTKRAKQRAEEKNGKDRQKI